MLLFKNVKKTFSSGEKEWNLGPLSFEIREKDFVAILGKSGSGKSTLLHLAGGLISPDEGDIFFKNNAEEKKFSTFSEHEKNIFRNQHIGFVFQEFFLLHEFTLLENTMFPLLIRGISKESSKEKAMDAIEKVGLLGKENNYPKELSGGQRQRAAIARALVTDPDILLADEPTGNLDLETGEEIIDLLCHLHKEKGKTLLLVTHDQSLAKVAEKIITIADGKII